MLWLTLILIPLVAGSQTLPEYMLGKYQLETSEGFDNFMYELGVRWIKRKIACTLYPKQVIAQTVDGEISLDTWSTLTSTQTKFRLNEPWSEYTADGRTTNTVATLTNNRLVKVQVADVDKGEEALTTREVREFLDGGNTMRMVLTIDGKPEIESIRVYKKLTD